MPIGEIAGEALGGVARFIGRVLFEIVFELILQGTGAILVRALRPKAKPSDATCAAVGLLFWVVVGIGGYFAYCATAG